jgi:hypothetical protein
MALTMAIRRIGEGYLLSQRPGEAGARFAASRLSGRKAPRRAASP